MPENSPLCRHRMCVCGYVRGRSRLRPQRLISNQGKMRLPWPSEPMLSIATAGRYIRRPLPDASLFPAIDSMRNLTKWFGVLLGSLLILGLFLLPYLEQTYAPEAANIQDVGDTVWYALVTLTTVGYGDYYPVSTPGQFVGALFVLSSLGVLGLLIGKIADLFTSYRERRRLGHHGQATRTGDGA